MADLPLLLITSHFKEYPSISPWLCFQKKQIWYRSAPFFGVNSQVGLKLFLVVHPVKGRIEGYSLVPNNFFATWCAFVL